MKPVIQTSAVWQDIKWGDRVRLIAGGPICLVVDVVDQMQISYAVIAWRCKDNAVKELTLPKICLQKV